MYWTDPRTWFRKPHPILIENQRYFSEFNQSRPLSEYSFVVLDTELTGLNRKKDEIVSIGAVKIEGLQINLGETFYRIVQPQNTEPNFSTLVHQITPMQMQQACPLQDVLEEFIRFVGTSMIVGHHVELDMYFLNRATWKHLGGTLSNPGIDTMRMARRYNQIQQGYFQDPTTSTSAYRLEDLNQQFNLPLFNAHDAFEDSLQTAYLFLWLIKKFDNRGGISTLKELYKAGHSG